MLEFIIGVVVGSAVTVKVIQWAFQHYIAKLKEELGISDDEPEPEDEVMSELVAKVEEHSGIFYVFAAEDGRFLAQGSTMPEVVEHARQTLKREMILDLRGPKDVITKLESTQPV